MIHTSKSMIHTSNSYDSKYESLVEEGYFSRMYYGNQGLKDYKS